MSNNNVELPSGWECPPLGDVLEIWDTLREPVNAKERANRVGDFPYYGANGQAGTIDDFRFDGDFVLLAEDGGNFEEPQKGVAYRVSGRFWVNNHAHALKPVCGMDTRFVVHALNSMNWMPYVSGTTRLKLNQAKMRLAPFQLPPLAEQRRIVGKIEALQERSRNAREALAEVGPLLEQFRQSLLAAAFRGDLTADWRAANPNTEPATELLARIRQERRQKWEQAELTKYEAKGKQPPKGWQDNYKEPEPVDGSELPALPDGWCWVTIEQLTFDGPTNGLYVPKTKYGHGTPILRIEDYQIDWCRPTSELQRVDIDETTIKTYSLQPSNLVVNRVNSPSHLGKTIVVEEVNVPAVFESNMMRLELSSDREARYVHFFLTSDFGKSLLTANAKWAVNQASINQGDVGSTAIPLAPAVEQAEILRLLGEGLASLKEVESGSDSMESSLMQLDQSILAKAFRGELVPQDPNDEPASVLLERIREARESEKADKSRKGPPKKVADITSPAPATANLLDVLRKAGTRLHVDDLQAASGLASTKFYSQLKDAIASGAIKEEFDDDNRYLVPAK